MSEPTLSPPGCDGLACCCPQPQTMQGCQPNRVQANCRLTAGSLNSSFPVSLHADLGKGRRRGTGPMRGRKVAIKYRDKSGNELCGILGDEAIRRRGLPALR
jgi:hypothetical protein